jgi:hypothetical protein
LQAGLQFTGIQPCSALSASLHDIVGTQPIQRATPMRPFQPELAGQGPGVMGFGDARAGESGWA